jgi:molecular chaperone DnaK (HSP70)
MPEAIRGNSWWQRDIAPSDGIVVAVDLGTYGTGIAYKAQGWSDEDIAYFTKWPGNPDLTYPKTLTAILYENGRPIKFGWEARIAYQLLEDHERTKGGYTYLDGFKLALDTGSRSKALPKGFTPVQVISDFLRLFKDHCLTKLRRDFPKGSVTWCLTVPAIWKDDQKDAMREAAWKAGMIPDKHSEQLCIILEPEAALLHAHARNLQLDAMATGATVMMVDAGGGTVDLTVHTIQRDGGGKLALAEAAPGNGGFCGSTYVDQNFEKWFRDQIGHGTFDSWKRQCYTEYMRVSAAPSYPQLLSSALYMGGGAVCALVPERSCRGWLPQPAEAQQATS